ncbi:hypothetical protein [Lachnoclostridium sp. An181]|uniref:hypothetical protein n=1 Tax=Lachnoclostridium sp. An181 TaxID=1965575 RepID=UPI000B3895BF|nr:hypothetical protein [Lachnoclostridium sp. An181]OUP51205.1 hypothetical protein B5F18_00350 [Lachnoclostridium sp. An181]
MPKWKMFLQKKNNLILLLLCGILLLVIAIPQGGKGGGVMEDAAASENVEGRLKQTLQKIEGVGELEVMLSKSEETSFYGEDDGSVQGVLIVCEHGDDPVVVERITEAVQALFDVDTHKIRIMKMNQTKQEENR